MNYKKVYDSLIAKRKLNPPTGYMERHHIVPRCLGGSDDKQNLVNLTAREHFIAHVLLTNIYKHETNVYYKLVKAVHMMLCSSSNQERYSPSRLYQRFRIEFSKIQSASQSGTKNSQFGTTWMHNKVTKENVKIPVSYTIPSGWELGRIIDWDRYEAKVAKKEKQQQLNQERQKIKEQQYREWYQLYCKVGYDEFVKITGYKSSKPNLVQRFAAILPEFVPQNGKRRGN